jgi:uncharacterized protein (DUF2267 family)
VEEKRNIMEELVKQVSSRTGISEDQARTAVTTVLGFLKDKLPAPIAGQIDNVLGGSAEGNEGGGGLGDLASKVGGMLGG